VRVPSSQVLVLRCQDFELSNWLADEALAETKAIRPSLKHSLDFGPSVPVDRLGGQHSSLARTVQLVQKKVECFGDA